MNRLNLKLARQWSNIGVRYLPFADAATPELPLGRLMRLSLFQFTVGMAVVMMIGTLNRVMIVELGVHAWVVALMVSLPLVFAPFRAIIGFKSDTHASVLGWRRVPYIWFGTLLQFGGLAIMPFALILLSGDTTGPAWIGEAGAALAFLMVGAGLHTVQTVGLALATDLAPVEARPRVVALLCAMFLVGMVVSAIVFGLLLADFSELRLIKVIQGSAVVTAALNIVALWKQEARSPSRTGSSRAVPTFADSWLAYRKGGRAVRRLAAIGAGTAAFSMQDILLEPYGGQVLHLPVGATTALTAMLAGGGALGLLVAAHKLNYGADPYRVAASGTLAGLVAFCAVIFAAPLESIPLFAIGVGMIGFGGGMFAHGTLTAAMGWAHEDETGFALGAWGSVQASAAGIAIALGGIIKDVVQNLAGQGALGEALNLPSTGYAVVYHIEIALLFVALVLLGPLVRRADDTSRSLEIANPAG